MIGKKQFIIDGQDIVTRGMSSGADITDGGFSNETDGVNLTANPGVVYAAGGATDKSTNLTGEAIAYTPGVAGTSVNGFILASDGKIMSISSSQNLTASSALTGTFTTGKSDIAQFQNNIYATSNNDVASMNTDLTGGNSTFWTGTLAKTPLTTGVPHPLLEFIGYLWIGDLNSLNRIESNSAGTNDALVLSSSNTVTALGFDSSAGKMLIGTVQDQVSGNYSDTLASRYTIFVYDGVSSTPEREIPVDGLVTAIKNVGGVTYITYGQKLGYWNGSGITFLRKLKNITLSGANLAYKNHLANIENTLYIVDGTQILAYGEVLAGRKIFYYCFKNNVNSNNFSLLCPVGSGQLGMGFATTKFYVFDTTSVSTTNTLTFFSNKISFPRPVILCGVYIEYATAIGTNDDNRSLYYQSEDLQTGLGLLKVQGQTTGSGLKNTSAASVYFIDNIIGFVANKVRNVQFRYLASTNNSGFRRIIVYYNDAE